MLSSLKILFATAVGVALGLAVTYAAVQRGVNFTTRRVGPWAVAMAARAGETDPYEQANLARRAEIPLGLGEGLSFVAARDSSGRALDASCDYVISHDTPAARYWSLTAMTPDGRLMNDPARRYGFTSAELVRAPNGDFSIEASHSARPGNWLPLGRSAGRFVLVLRLYDTPIATSVNTLDADDMPQIIRKRCQ